MRVFLRISAIAFQRAPVDWWTDPALLRRIWDEVRRAGLHEGFSHAGPAGGTLARVDGLDAAAARSARWKAGVYTVQSDASETPERSLDLHIGPGDLTLVMAFRQSYLDRAGATLLDQLVDFVRGLHAGLRGIALLGPVVQVEVLGLRYARLRPPRMHRHFAPGKPVLFASREFHASSPAGDPEDLEALLSADLDPGMEREEDGGLVIFRSARGLSDKEAVRRGLAVQAAWVTRVLQPPIESGYNELGDLQMMPSALAPRPPLTLYDAFSGIGYKAGVAPGGGALDPDALAEAAGWLQAGQLPDGTRLERLYLILPSRETALRVRDQALAVGVSGVLYTGDSGLLWDPAPPGEWVDAA